MQISLILDCSGSMTELAKHKILQGIVGFFQQYTLISNQKLELNYCTWNEQGVLNIALDQTINLQFFGKNHLQDVIQYIRENYELNYILISDGCFLDTEIHFLQSEFKRQQLDHFRIICVGSDDKRALKASNFGKLHVFDVEEVSQVIPSLLLQKSLQSVDLIKLVQ
jgi:hypothetical protein